MTSLIRRTVASAALATALLFGTATLASADTGVDQSNIGTGNTNISTVTNSYTVWGPWLPIPVL